MKNILKSIVFSAVLLGFSGGFIASCEKTTTDLKGTKWKLVGIVDVETEVLWELEPANCEECYQITFWGNMIPGYTINFSGHAETGGLTGIYELVEETSSIQMQIWLITDHNEPPNGSFFIETLNNVHSFSLRGNVLNLYYENEKKYLQFKPQKQ